MIFKLSKFDLAVTPSLIETSNPKSKVQWVNVQCTNCLHQTKNEILNKMSN